MTLHGVVRGFRVGIATLFAVVLSSCVDTGGTGANAPGHATLKLGIAFQPAGSTQVDATVRKVRVVVRVTSPGPARVLTDVVKDIAAQNDDETIAVDFALQGDDAVYDVEVSGSNAANETLYRGGPVSFSASSLSASGNVTVEARVFYVGPGSEAVSVTASPSPLNLLVGASGTITAQAFGPNSSPISRTLFEWNVTSGAGIATVDNTGRVVAGNQAGSATIQVSVPSQTRPSASVVVNVTFAPSQIILESGGGQSAPTGAELANPIVVRVLASNNTGVPGVLVTFAPVNGSVSASPVMTDAGGRAQTRWRMSTATGPHTMSVSVPGVAPLQVTATAVQPTQPTLAVVSGGGQSGTAGAQLSQPIVFSLTNGTTPIGGATITFSAGQGGSAAPTSGITDAQGRLQVNWTLGPVAGTQTLTATSTSAVNSPITVNATANLAVTAVFIVQAAPSALTPGQQSTLTAFVGSGANNTPVNGAVVTFESSGTGNTITPVTATTNSQGLATTVFSSTVAEVKSITATSGSIRSAVLSLPVAVANNSGTAMQKVSGDNQSVRFGQDFQQPIVVRVLNALGQPISNAFVDFSSANGLLRRVTDANGIASQLYSLAPNPSGFPVGTVGSIDVFLVNNNAIKVTFTFTVIP